MAGGAAAEGHAADGSLVRHRDGNSRSRSERRESWFQSVLLHLPEEDEKNESALFAWGGRAKRQAFFFSSGNLIL
jgi:hypothetical protein